MYVESLVYIFIMVNNSQVLYRHKTNNKLPG